MAGVRLLSVGAGILSGVVVASAMGYGLYCSGGDCGASKGMTGDLAVTAPAEASVLADAKGDDCNKPCPMSAQNKTDLAGVVAQPGAKVGDKVACPKNGEVFTVAADSDTIQVDGETVYVCCASCGDDSHDDGAAFVD